MTLQLEYLGRIAFCLIGAATHPISLANDAGHFPRRAGLAAWPSYPGRMGTPKFQSGLICEIYRIDGETLTGQDLSVQLCGDLPSLRYR